MQDVRADGEDPPKKRSQVMLVKQQTLQKKAEEASGKVSAGNQDGNSLSSDRGEGAPNSGKNKKKKRP